MREGNPVPAESFDFDAIPLPFPLHEEEKDDDHDEKDEEDDDEEEEFTNKKKIINLKVAIGAQKQLRWGTPSCGGTEVCGTPHCDTTVSGCITVTCNCETKPERNYVLRNVLLMSIIKHMPDTKKYGTGRKKLEEFWIEVAASFTENVKAMGFTRKVDAQSLKLVWKQMERETNAVSENDKVLPYWMLLLATVEKMKDTKQVVDEKKKRLEEEKQNLMSVQRQLGVFGSGSITSETLVSSSSNDAKDIDNTKKQRRSKSDDGMMTMFNSVLAAINTPLLSTVSPQSAIVQNTVPLNDKIVSIEKAIGVLRDQIKGTTDESKIAQCEVRINLLQDKIVELTFESVGIHM